MSLLRRASAGSSLTLSGQLQKRVDIRRPDESLAGINIPGPEFVLRAKIELNDRQVALQEGLLAEVVDVARKYAHRIDRSRVPAVSAWTKDIATRVEHDPEGKKRTAV